MTTRNALAGGCLIHYGMPKTGIDATDLHGILALLGSTCGDLRACGFVRSPASFMESVFQQRLKSGNATFNPRALYPGYRARLEKFDLALGRERVTH